MPGQSDYQYGQRFAELYDLIPGYANRSDIGFYRELYRQNRESSLEIGCGTGRVLIPAALEGCKITGIDRVHAVVGGFHLATPAFEPRIPPTVEALREFDPTFNPSRTNTLADAYTATDALGRTLPTHRIDRRLTPRLAILKSEERFRGIQPRLGVSPGEQLARSQNPTQGSA